MRILIFIVMFSLSLFANEEQVFNFEELLKNEDFVIFANIEEIYNINGDIATFTQKSIDKNLTIFDDEIDYLQASKLKILQNLPIELIKNKDTSYEQIEQIFDEQIILMQEKVDELFNKNYFFDFTYMNNKLLALKAAKSFYGVLFNLKLQFAQGANKRQIDRFLKDSIKDLQTAIFSDGSELEDKLSQAQLDILQDEVQKYRILLDSYEEILIYFSKNSYIFQEDSMIKNLKLNILANYINENLNVENKIVDSGKLFVMSFLTIFIYLIRRLIYNFIYYIVIKTILRKNYKKDVVEKSKILNMIEKPVGFLLILFNIDLWATLFYHPAPVLKHLKVIFQALYVFNLAWFVIALISIYGVLIIEKFTDIKDKKEVANLALKMLKIIIAIISFIIILDIFGFDPTALLASFGIGGLAIAFASKDIIANFFSSILLIFENSISQGDDVIIGSASGTIVEIGLRNTIVRDDNNALIFIPNSKIVDSEIINLSRRKLGRRMRFLIAIDNKLPKEKIDEIMDEIKEMLYTNNKIAHSKDSSKNYDEIIQNVSSFVSADDLEGFKSSIYVYLSALSLELAVNTNYKFAILVECFSKTINARQYHKTKDEIFFNIIDIFEEKDVDFSFIKE